METCCQSGNPFTPEPPVQSHDPLYRLWRHRRRYYVPMITIQSYIVDPKILMKILFHYPLELHFIPSNPKILKVFPKIFPTEVVNAQQRKKQPEKRGNKSESGSGSEWCTQISLHCCVILQKGNFLVCFCCWCGLFVYFFFFSPK